MFGRVRLRKVRLSGVVHDARFSFYWVALPGPRAEGARQALRLASQGHERKRASTRRQNYSYSPVEYSTEVPSSGELSTPFSSCTAPTSSQDEGTYLQVGNTRPGSS
jgi:hypothetical protein